MQLCGLKSQPVAAACSKSSDGKSPSRRWQVADCLSELSVMLQQTEQFEAGEGYARQALALYEEL